METGTILGGTSLLLYCLDKTFVLLKHFKLVSKCCGSNNELSIDASTPKIKIESQPKEITIQSPTS
jgi:hypothetical protein